MTISVMYGTIRHNEKETLWAGSSVVEQLPFLFFNMTHLFFSSFKKFIIKPRYISPGIMDDLVELDGLHYKKFTDAPFTGEVTGKYQGSFRNGKKDGHWASYWNYGQLFEKGTYKDGEKDGLWVYYREDGTVWEEYTETFKDCVKVD